MRFLVWDNEDIVGHAGLDYRIMNLAGKEVKVLGIIDVAVSIKCRGKGVASVLLTEIIRFAEINTVDFILLFTENPSLYIKQGFRIVNNNVRWLMVDHEKQISIGVAVNKIDGMMIKEIGRKSWIDSEELDLLGYMY